MANIKDQSNAIKRLLEDETFQAVLSAVRQRQVDTFADVSSTIEAREEAHAKLRALAEVEIYISTVLTDEMIFDKYQSK